MKRLDLAVLIGAVLAIALSSFTTFAQECDAVRENVVRLHILANSDSQADQELKLAVRDAVLLGTAQLFSASSDKTDTEREVLEHMDEIEAIAREEIQRQGYDYPVSVSLTNMFFETRQYENFTMPAGYYDAVRILIGEGAGKNWWCVMFPPLCIPAASPKSEMTPTEQIRLIGTRPQYKAKLAVVELVETVADHFSGRSEQPVILPE
ncbi:stage II sporulation protein R [Oscillospiraceae bacterium MB08-C2-2]|nr:stage II sporulation protein R [Oscillospiraceae bacterium MB08-C2-2]